MRAQALLAAAALAASLLGCARPDGSDAGRLFRVHCSRCHTVDTPLSKRKDLEGWRRTVWVMRQRGAELTDQEAEGIAKHLAQIRGL